MGPIVGRNMDSGIGDPVMFRFPEEMGHSYMGTAADLHVARHRLIERLLHEAKSNPSVEAMRRMMRDHTPPSPVCKHLDQMPEDYPLATRYSFLLVPRTGEYYFWVTRPGPGYPCTFEPTHHRFSFQ